MQNHGWCFFTAIENMDGMDVFTATIAIIGLGLGVYNALYNARKDKIRLTVFPLLAIKLRMGGFTMLRGIPTKEEYEENKDSFWVGVGVVNNSYFPVKISEVGLYAGGRLQNRCKFEKPTIYGGGDQTLPLVLPRGDSANFLVQFNSMDMRLYQDIKSVYASDATFKIHVGLGEYNLFPTIKKIAKHRVTQSNNS